MVATVEEDGCPGIVGGARYIVLRPGQSEVAIAIAVIDAYRGQSIGASLMMRHLAAIARAAGLQELIAEVLPDNTRC